MTYFFFFLLFFFFKRFIRQVKFLLLLFVEKSSENVRHFQKFCQFSPDKMVPLRYQSNVIFQLLIIFVTMTIISVT